MSAPALVRRSPMRRPLQIATFMRKEAVDVLRQPRLLLVLVIGPFALLAAFAVGYREQPAPMRTMFVVPADSPFRDQIEQIAGDLDGFVEYRGTTADAEQARDRLVAGDIDLVVTFPDDPVGTVLDGEQAPITVVHTRLDPIERTAISFSSQLAVDRINGQILATVLEDGRAELRPATTVLDTARAAVAAMRAAAAAGDEAGVATSAAELGTLLGDLDASIRATDLVSRQLTGTGIDGGAVTASVGELRDATEGLDAARVDPAQLDELDAGLAALQEQYARFADADPAVLVRPFSSDVEIAVDRVGQLTDWYAPAAVVLMLQQFGVAFGALTFVRERQLGIADVFRIAPVDATETLVGKYLAYMTIGGGIAALLTSLVVVTLDVPLLSGLGDVVVVMALSLFASIGLGFVVSLASANDAQAVQYTMLTLLASLFFSGFFLGVGQLEGVATVIGWLLPVTYGMQLLRDVMLRGADPDPGILLGLAGYGAAMFLLALLGTRRRMSLAPAA